MFGKKSLIVGMVLTLTAAHYLTSMAQIEVHDLFRRLYFVPIVYAAYSFGLGGGIATSLLISILYTPFIFTKVMDPAHRFDQLLEVIVFNGMGFITGLLSGREKDAFQRLENLLLGTIKSLVSTIEARDPYTKGHSVRVMYIATLLGRKLRLSGTEIRSLQIGALLHDIGKVAIDFGLLNKPSSLSQTEQIVMQKHPDWGARILGHIDELQASLPVVSFHHEKFDGSGYPHALKGEQIPLPARIVAAADVLDAMTTDRPYKKARSFNEAFLEIKALSGSYFDPQIVELMDPEEIERELKQKSRESNADFSWKD